jgi:hypothetical protein
MSNTVTYKRTIAATADAMRGLQRTPAQQCVANLENALRVARELADSGDSSGMHVTTLRSEINNSLRYLNLVAS